MEIEMSTEKNCISKHKLFAHHSLDFAAHNHLFALCTLASIEINVLALNPLIDRLRRLKISPENRRARLYHRLARKY
jgi:hypothetical protein